MPKSIKSATFQERERRNDKEQGKPLLRLERSLTTENLWIYILLLLSKKKLHPYAIVSEMQTHFGWQPGLITPYVVMYKLAKEGYIKPSQKERRCYYTITKKGRTLLNKAKERFQKIMEIFE